MKEEIWEIYTFDMTSSLFLPGERRLYFIPPDLVKWPNKP